MPSHTIRSRPPRGDARVVEVCRDPDILASYARDAAHVTGTAAGVVVATSEREVADVLRQATAVLPIGAQSSLTGGASPRGELIVSTAGLRRVGPVTGGTVRVDAGLTLAELDEALEGAGCFYPPAPTFTGAFVGGSVATNAAGAATFKYGVTRQWVDALTVVLPDGDVLDVERGRTLARDGRFELQLARGTVQVEVPSYRLPSVPKVSAGYFAAPDMDLIDLFIGAEGTLGVITAVTLRVVPARPAQCLAFVPFPGRSQALRFTTALREEARRTWRERDARGIDVSAIEHVDRRCLELLREDGVDRLLSIGWPDASAIALLVTLDLPAGTTAEQAFVDIGRSADADAPDTPLVRFCRRLSDAGVVDDVAMAVPGDRQRAGQLAQLREAVPMAVNQRVGRAQQAIDARIDKTAADMIVPFARLEELLALYDAEFAQRGLDIAVWGHISDGNLHPNVLPRSYAEVESGKAAVLACGRAVIAMGGSPLAEHGVGRNPVKQQLLRELYGDAGIDEMRRVKRAIDPSWKMAPGVLFPAP